MEAFEALGYKPEQVTKILLTHRHADHSGELKSFPNAKVYVNQDETDAAELQGLTNIVPVTYTDLVCPDGLPVRTGRTERPKPTDSRLLLIHKVMGK
jgi:glyoxylase-like metal-dependent hydrolase (beta-lactamase superfamily II)